MGVATRKVVWYTIVRYISDVIKGELLNVGVILNVPEDGVMKYKFIAEKNTKLKSILISKVEKESYKYGVNYLNFMLESIDSNDTFFAANTRSNTFITQVINQELPAGFVFSETRFAKSNNVNDLFKSLLKEYVGENFLKEEIGINSMFVKKKATQLIDQREKLSDIVQSNMRIRPVENIPKNYTIDFGYAENNKLSIIQAAPDKVNTSYDWLDRMSFISNNYQQSENISILYNSVADSNKDHSMEQMLSFLKSKDNRIQTFDIFSRHGELDFQNELSRIEQRAGTIEELRTLVS